MKKRPDPSRQKQSQIIKAITEMAREMGPGAKLPTIQTFSEKYNVTLTTLDRALAKLEDQGVVTRRQGSGTYVADGIHRKRIGLVFGQSIFRFGYSSFYQLLLHHCQRYSESEDDDLYFFMNLTKKRKGSRKETFNQEIQKALTNKTLDGLLLFEVYLKEQLEWLAKFDLPTVSQSETPYFPHVGFSIQSLIELGVESLIDAGCKEIGLIAVVRKHLDVFRKVVGKYDIKVNESAVISAEDEQAPPYTMHEPLGRQWIQQCIENCGGKKNLPAGLLITDDMVTRGACLHLNEIGMRPGKQITIASHANEGSLVLEYWKDSLIQLEFSPGRQVDEMFRKLKKAMDGHPLRRTRQLLKPSVNIPTKFL